MNSSVTLDPNNHPAPRGLIVHFSMSSGSDHTKSQNAPKKKNKKLIKIIKIKLKMYAIFLITYHV